MIYYDYFHCNSIVAETLWGELLHKLICFLNYFPSDSLIKQLKTSFFLFRFLFVFFFISFQTIVKAEDICCWFPFRFIYCDVYVCMKWTYMILVMCCCLAIKSFQVFSIISSTFLPSDLISGVCCYCCCCSRSLFHLLQSFESLINSNNHFFFVYFYLYCHFSYFYHFVYFMKRKKSWHLFHFMLQTIIVVMHLYLFSFVSYWTIRFWVLLPFNLIFLFALFYYFINIVYTLCIHFPIGPFIFIVSEKIPQFQTIFTF